MEVLQKTLYVTELWRNPRTGSVAGGSGRRIGCWGAAVTRGRGSFARAQPVAVRMLDRLTLHTRVCDTIVCMQVDRFSVTMETDLGAAVRDAAERAGMSVSGWLAQAAADRLRNDLLGVALDAWEAEDGPFGDEELDAAAAALGIARGSRGHAA
jgi:hypothetical protein